MSQEQIFSVSGDRDLRPVCHFNITSIVTNKFLHKIEVYEMGIMRAEKITVI